MASKPKPRNGGTYTEARYWSQVRSHLRNAFRYWSPMMDAKKEARRPSQSENKRMKWEYKCAHCNQWFPEKQVSVDHTVPVGALKCEEDLVPFLRRLTPENGFQVLCKDCHQIKTNEERKCRK